LVITKTREHGDVEANQHDVSLSFMSENLAQAVDEFAKQLKFCAKACGDNEHS